MNDIGFFEVNDRYYLWQINPFWDAWKRAQSNKKTGKIIVKGINFKFKHSKPRTENEVGEIKQFEAPIHHSNVTLSN